MAALILVIVDLCMDLENGRNLSALWLGDPASYKPESDATLIWINGRETS
jgi:hypothetical protein